GERDERAGGAGRIDFGCVDSDYAALRVWHVTSGERREKSLVIFCVLSFCAICGKISGTWET
ncbi:MAG: hypothetical protein KGJ80_00975, partial [Chloroflexota bacterium]|nr:hypothetical protein [Chloroflexota bacterium]